MLYPTLRDVAYLKALIILMILLFWSVYIVFSYFQAVENIKQKDRINLFEEQEEITETFKKYQEYLQLTESRLLRASHKEEVLTRILSERTDHIIGKNFPEIISLIFIPTSTSSVRYTRFGKASLVHIVKDEKPGLAHLEKGTFRLNKILYDKNQKTFGTLQSTISIKSLLYKHFAEHEISVVAEQGKNVAFDQPYFKVMGLPYAFVLNRDLPSFWQFLYEYKFQVFFTLILGTLLLFIGLGIGGSLSRKILLKQHLLIQRRREKLKIIEHEKADLVIQLNSTKNLLNLEEKAQKNRDLLFNNLQERYRQMASRAQAINTLTAKLISEDESNDGLMKEIHTISQESNIVLRRLINGYPMKEIEENIDILESIKHIKTIFLPKLIERNVQFEIIGKIQKFPIVDKIILEIVLHNIFHIVMGRLLKDNVFKIEFKGQDPLQITFYDNGYDIEEKIRSVKNNAESENILCLSKKGLGEFISYLGWNVYFQNEGALLNSITLSIPLVFNEKIIPQNVIKLLDYKQL